MRILMINSVCGIRSTGRICTDLATALEAEGHEVKIAYGRESVPEQFQRYAVRIGSDNDVRLHGFKARLMDGCGFGSKRATKRFVEWVKDYDPDVIHLHNLHGYYINIEVLFNYLRTCGKKIIWTLHDCWAFTGHSAYCDAVDCERWKTGCYKCPNLKEYPMSLTDRSRDNWHKKKALMIGIPEMTIVTPSEWLARLIRDSFLKEYPIEVIHNGIDLAKFHPLRNDLNEMSSEVFIETEKNESPKESAMISDAAYPTCDSVEDNTEGFWRSKAELGLIGKRVLLGVSAMWETRKGLEDIFKLSQQTDAQIILIGLSEKQIAELPDNIIAFQRTNSVEELRRLYAIADMYINPTYEDNFPTTNIEALACGTPVATYRTGGSPEAVDEKSGVVIDKGDYLKLANRFSCSVDDCVRRSKLFTKETMLKAYRELYD